MTIPDTQEVTLKKMVLYLESNSLTLQAVSPANQAELKELRELDKKGLTKFFVVDASLGFIAHKSAAQKLIADLAEGDTVAIKLIDRAAQGHNLVQIYASNICVRKIELTPAQFKQLRHEEDMLLKNHEKTR